MKLVNKVTRSTVGDFKGDWIIDKKARFSHWFTKKMFMKRTL